MTKLKTNFVDGPFVENLNNYNVLVEFIDNDEQEIVHSDVLKPNYWSRVSRKWFTNWRVLVKREGEIIYNHQLDCKGKKIFIWFDSSSLGDNIGWFPYVEEFCKKHECEIICSTFWNNLFKETYPKIKFVEPGSYAGGIYASYMVGDFDGDSNKNKNEWRSVPLQKIAADVLGLPYKSIKPRLKIPDYPKNIKNKYVCIAIHSTLQCKYWNYPKGWQIIVNYLHKIGYDVVQISKEGKWHKGNRMPNRTINKTGDYSIEDRMVDLKHAEMFIGVSSGLAWLSWAVGTPTIIVSGVTNPWVEPSDGVERIFNSEVCNGCLNDTSLQLDRGNWNWCPRNKDFECSKSITPDMVIKSIDNIIKNKNA